MAFHITVVSATGEPAMEEEDLFLYAGYFAEASGKSLHFKPYFYEVQTESDLQVRHIVLQEETLSSEDVVFVITDLPCESSGKLEKVTQDKVSTVVKEMLIRCGSGKITMDGTFVPDPTFVARRPSIATQIAYRFTGSAKVISDDIAKGQRSRFQLINSDENEG